MTKRKPGGRVEYETLIPAKSALYPNAVGRYSEDDDWMPVHIMADGVQVDANGLYIQPFAHVLRMEPDQLDEWLKAHRVVPFRLEAAMVPTALVRK